ncbi:MAG: ATP synthase subunit I, partial [Nitrospinota bacterium]|nr:ATP synthase subunit I [Nitrospinota bacterium]
NTVNFSIMPVEPLSAKTTAIGILSAQLVLGIVTAGMFWFFLSFESAKSSIAGSMVAVFSSVHILRLVFQAAPQNPKKIANTLYLMEALKFLITGVLFGVAVILLKAMFFPLIIGYIVAVFVYWLSLLVV